MTWRRWTAKGLAWGFVGASLCLLLVPADARGGTREEQARAELAARRLAILVEAGTARAKVGVWCRDAGMVAQASAEFIRADEVAEGKNIWAQRILMFMRKLDDKFWKGKLEKPSAGMIRAYEKRAKKAQHEYERARLRLAAWADKKGLEEEAYEEYRAVVRLSDDSVHVDDDGLVVVEAGKVPEAYSKRLLADAVTIDGKPRVRDAFLEKAPEVKEVFEASNDALLVRSDVSQDLVDGVCRVCTALLPFLEADLGGRPTQRMKLFLFKERKSYEAYCEAAGLGSHKAAAGVADGATFAAVIAAEGIDGDGLTGVAMHEMTHLFQYGVTPTVMPSWFNEGFAETYGGTGTWSWDGTKLTAGGRMPPERITPLAGDTVYIPLDDLLRDDALKLINENRQSARVFYDEAWAFLRFLRHGEPDLQQRFERYTLMCLGAALGAKAGEYHNRDATDARAFFQSTFGPDLPQIEDAFRAWLRAYPP